jgi:penicillin-binding protein-related factor A (putative recombinase)
MVMELVDRNTTFTFPERTFFNNTKDYNSIIKGNSFVWCSKKTNNRTSFFSSMMLLKD